MTSSPSSTSTKACPQPVSIIDAYDPERASQLAGCWLYETVNGQEGDFGDLEYICLNKVDRGQFHATYKSRAGPAIGMCHQGVDCGYQPPFGVREACTIQKPWLSDVSKLPSSPGQEHFHLQTVMGMDADLTHPVTKMFHEAPLRETMYDNSRQIKRPDCGFSHPYWAWNSPTGFTGFNLLL